MSCKGSIKANHRLRQDEILELLDTLRQTSDPFTCPHGRPIIIHFSTYEMEKCLNGLCKGSNRVSIRHSVFKT